VSRDVFPSEAYSILYRIILRLIITPERRRLPNADSLSCSAPRRPGELLERVDLPKSIGAPLASVSEGANVPIDVAATLLWEAALLLSRLEAVGIPQPDALLDEAAAERKVSCALSAAESDYLRALTQVRWRRHAKAIAVPIRLLTPLRSIEPRVLTTPPRLQSTVAWEAAALLGGMTMAEWGLAVALERA
jgi:hypothetical protein